MIRHLKAALVILGPSLAFLAFAGLLHIATK
jgi:hypothetical protein